MHARLDGAHGHFQNVRGLAQAVLPHAAEHKGFTQRGSEAGDGPLHLQAYQAVQRALGRLLGQCVQWKVLLAVTQPVGIDPECDAVQPGGEPCRSAVARESLPREYRDLLGQILRKMPVPAQSNSYVVMEEIKEGLALPVDPVPVGA